MKNQYVIRKTQESGRITYYNGTYNFFCEKGAELYANTDPAAIIEIVKGFDGKRLERVEEVFINDKIG